MDLPAKRYTKQRMNCSTLAWHKRHSKWCMITGHDTEWQFKTKEEMQCCSKMFTASLLNQKKLTSENTIAPDKSKRDVKASLNDVIIVSKHFYVNTWKYRTLTNYYFVQKQKTQKRMLKILSNENERLGRKVHKLQKKLKVSYLLFFYHLLFFDRLLLFFIICCHFFVV